MEIGTDVLLFPRSIRYRNVKPEQIPALINDLIQDKVLTIHSQTIPYSFYSILITPYYDTTIYVFILFH